LTERDQVTEPGREMQLQALIDGLVVFDARRWRGYYTEGLDPQPYGNPLDPDDEYEIVLDEASLRAAEESRSRLLKLVSEDDSLIPATISAMARKLASIPREAKYELGLTEDGYPDIRPEPGIENDRWPSYGYTRQHMFQVVRDLAKQDAASVSRTKFDSIRGRLDRQVARMNP
jgi:hypothetical protein